MALQKTITVKDNFGDDKVFQDAYIRINHVYAQKDSCNVTIDFHKEQGGRVIKSENHYIPGDLALQTNVIKNCYLALKGRPEFADAVDC